MPDSLVSRRSRSISFSCCEIERVNTGTCKSDAIVVNAIDAVTVDTSKTIIIILRPAWRHSTHRLVAAKAAEFWLHSSSRCRIRKRIMCIFPCPKCRKQLIFFVFCFLFCILSRVHTQTVMPLWAVRWGVISDKCTEMANEFQCTTWYDDEK